MQAFDGVFSAGLDVPFLCTLDRKDMKEWHYYFIDALLAMVETPCISVAALNGIRSLAFFN